MKKLKFLLVLCCILSMAAFAVSCGAREVFKGNEDFGVGDASEFVTGESISLYLNEQDPVYLSQVASIKPFTDYFGDRITILNPQIADSSIAVIYDGALVAVAIGKTEFTWLFGNVLITQEVVVYDGARTVDSVAVSGSNDGNYYLGKTYSLSSINSSNCPMSELAIDVTPLHDGIDGQSLATVDENGNITFVGVGEVEVWVHSKTNAKDKGVKFSLASDFEDKNLKSVVEQNISDRFEDGVLTVEELSLIDKITVDSSVNLGSISSAVLPCLQTVEVNLANSVYGNGIITLSGFCKWKFVGDSTMVYDFYLTGEECEKLVITFDSVRALGLDFSAVDAVDMKVYGDCSFAPASVGADYGKHGVIASALRIGLKNGATLSCAGASGRVCGGDGINARNLSIESDNEYSSVFVYGGNGMRGNDGSASGASGGNGGNGGNAIYCAGDFVMEGSINATLVSGAGGNGGNGKVGANGSNGAKGNNESQGADSVYGYNGRPGGDGGKGGNGGNGGASGNCLYVNTVAISGDITISFEVSSSGNGGNGANGGNGGRGGDGGDDDNWSLLGIGDMAGGEGGRGGAAGAAGSKGYAGLLGSYCILGNATDDFDFITVSYIQGVAGVNGSSGVAGTPGSNGKHGDGGAM